MDVVSGGGGPRKWGRDSGKGVATWPTQGTEIELVTAGGSWDGPTRSFRRVGRASRNRPSRADGESTQPLASVTRRSRVGRRVPAAMTARWPRPASRLMASEKPQAEDLTCDAILRALWPQSDTSAPRSPRPAGASCSVQCITDPSRDSSRLEPPPKPVPTAHGHERHHPPTPATSCHSASPAACVRGGGGDPDLGPQDSEPYRAVVGPYLTKGPRTSQTPLAPHSYRDVADHLPCTVPHIPATSLQPPACASSTPSPLHPGP